jgi:hypothetical protein
VLRAIGRFEHAIAQLAQDFHGMVSDILLVVDYEDGLLTCTLRHSNCRLHFRIFDRALQAPEIEFDGQSLPDLRSRPVCCTAKRDLGREL